MADHRYGLTEVLVTECHGLVGEKGGLSCKVMVSHLRILCKGNRLGNGGSNGTNFMYPVQASSWKMGPTCFRAETCWPSPRFLYVPGAVPTLFHNQRCLCQPAEVDLATPPHGTRLVSFLRAWSSTGHLVRMGNRSKG